MKKLFSRSFIRALIITVISALIIAGSIYAYETFWSGEAHITIEVPDVNGESDLEVTNVSCSFPEMPGSETSFEDGVWTVTMGRDAVEGLFITIENSGDDYGVVETFVDGKSYRIYPLHDVSIWAGQWEYTIPADDSRVVKFWVNTGLQAEAGTLSDISLEIREKT